MEHVLTKEQTDIVTAASHGNANLMISAYAGCAKTSTLVSVAKVLTSKNNLALAFNIKNKKDLEARLPDTFECKTLNGLGHAAWQFAISRRIGVEEKKLFNILSSQGASRDLFGDIISATRYARMNGFMPAEFAAAKSLVGPRNFNGLADLLEGGFHDPEITPFVMKLLVESVKQGLAGVIDYDDQIYLSALFPTTSKAFDTIFVDEAQDLSPLNHEQIAKMRKGRLIVCGDPKQAIYGFRGASQDSMAKIRNLRPADTWEDFPLTLTFRCPKTVVQRQQQHAPGFTAAPEAPEGQFLSFSEMSLKNLIDLPKPVAVLCRNNAPLLGFAFKLIKHGIGPQILGRELGKGLKNILNKIVPDGDIPKPDILSLITEWAAEQIKEVRAKEQEQKVAGIEDRRECLYAIFSEGVETKEQALDALDKIFHQDNVSLFVLSTGHKAKGLEWPSVVHLEPHLIPSKYAQKQAAKGDYGPIEQDYNLRYVIETRAKNVLVNCSKFNPDKK